MADTFNPAKLYSVDGLVAVITGGGTGLGATMAKTLIANGASKVYITGRRLEKLEETAKQAEAGKIVPIQASVTSHDDLQRAVDKVTAETGHIDLLINNAGVTNDDYSPDARPVPTRESSAAEVRDYYFNHQPASLWQNCLNTNVAAVFTTTMAFLELLVAGNTKRKGGPTSQIITMGSVAGFTRYTDSFMYNASKAAVHHLAKNLGAAFVPYDIRSNVIVPGLFRSGMTDPFVDMLESHGVPKDLIPSQRVGSEQELAGTLLYLASAAGGYCNGGMMLIDGGFMSNHAGI